MSFLLATVLIVAIMALTISFSIKALASTPARVAVVIAAIVGLLAPLPRVIEALNQQSAPTAPAQPAPVLPPPYGQAVK